MTYNRSVQIVTKNSAVINSLMFKVLPQNVNQRRQNVFSWCGILEGTVVLPDHNNG